jgi:hypothetical protein
MLHWLVVLTSFNHLEKSWSSSMGRKTSHNMKWKVKVMFQTTKQSRFLNAYGMAWAIQFASPHPQQWPWRPWTNPPATSKVPTVSMLAAMMGVPLHTCDSGPSPNMVKKLEFSLQNDGKYSKWGVEKEENCFLTACIYLRT